MQRADSRSVIVSPQVDRIHIGQFDRLNLSSKVNRVFPSQIFDPDLFAFSDDCHLGCPDGWIELRCQHSDPSAYNMVING
jgi:hypothetical protein